MNYRRIASRLAAAFAPALLASCGAGGSNVRGGEGPDTGGDVLKISHFRAFEHPQTKKLEPTYKVVLSATWLDRIGETAREPLPLAAPSNIYRGTAPDEKMRHYAAKLRELGMNTLVARNPDSLRPEEFNRLSLHPTETSYTRVFTVGSDKGAKSYYYRDQQQSRETIKAFLDCERYIMSIMNGHTIRTQTKTDPVFRKDQ